MNNCPNCFKEEATIHPQLGPLPGKICKERLDKLPSPRAAVEIIPERIKSERQERGDSILQPHLKGELDKRWTDLWGEDAARERGFSEKEIKNAKYVSDGIRGKSGMAMTYYKNRT